MSVYDLAALLASYEADEPHVGLPDCPADAEENYPETTADDVRGWLALEHDGDCLKKPAPCMRCWGEQMLHKAQWLWRRGVRLDNREP